MKINDLLIEQITNYLNPYLEKFHDYSIENRGNKIEVIGSTEGKPTSLFVLIQLNVNEDWKQIFISKIYMPEFMKHQGIGKQLIKVIYKAAKRLKYELFLDQITNSSFYERMRKRGALQCEEPDMLQIVDSTMLD
jgi:hypothetical protein